MKSGIGLKEKDFASHDKLMKAISGLDRRYRESLLARQKCTQRNKKDSVPIDYNVAQKPEQRRKDMGLNKVQLEPIKQEIGKKAVPWKTKSNWGGDFSYQILLERQLAKAKKYCPTQDPSKLVDLSAMKRANRDAMFEQIASNFKK